MIEDLRDYPPGASVSADVCLIGAGAAGITMAREFIGTALSVCLVEGGGMGFEFEESQSLYAGDSVGAPVSLLGGRLRFLGGTTNHWGGRCARLEEIDFQQRDWVPHSGWPIDRTELDPYYARACAVAGFASPWPSDADTLSYLKVSLPSLDEDRIRPFLWRYTPATQNSPAWSWGSAYGKQISDSSNVRLLLHANFAGFSLQGKRRIRSLSVRAVNGRAAEISARTFVLCCGGIENARLLLLSAEQNSGGFGSENDLVGRFLMQHARGVAGIVVSAERMSRVQGQFNVLRSADDRQFEIGLTLAPKVQASERVLNCSGVLQYEGDPDSGVAAAQAIWRALLTGRWPVDVGEKVGRVGLDFGAFTQGLGRRLRSGHSLASQGSLGIPSRSAMIIVDLEQAPDPQSRVSLTDARDALGLRRVRVDWVLGETERGTAAAFMRHIGAEFARLGIGRCRMAPWLIDARMPLAQALAETYHYIGTTRMSDDPRNGVVDRNCAVHGMDNLYVAGSSVFPTAGQANPTLTIVALALRLAGRLKG